MTRTCLRLVLLLATGAAPAPAAERPVADPGLRLLAAGRFDEGNRLLGVSAQLTTLAERAKGMGDAAEALNFYEAYLRYFPFESLDYWGRHDAAEWNRAAIPYAELLAATERPGDERSRQTFASLPLYKRLVRAYEADDPDAYSDLAEEIVRDYPQSLFVEASVLTACCGVQERNGNSYQRTLSLIDEFLAQMKQAGLPEERRLLVRLYRQRVIRHREVSAGRRPTRSVPPAEVLRLSANPLLRRAYLFGEFADLVRASQLELSRGAGERYLAELTPLSLREGRSSVVHACLKAEKPEEALRWSRRWAAQGQLSDRAEGLRAVADHFSQKRQWAAAAKLYQEVLDSAADDWNLGNAKLGLATAAGARGDDVRMVTILKDLAGPPDAPAGENGPGLSRRNEACQRLAAHYTRQKDWREALTWWERWRPQSFCGNCHEAMTQTRDGGIAECRRQLAVKP